jgi:hypothetical protein
MRMGPTRGLWAQPCRPALSQLSASAQAAININNSVEELGLYGRDGGRLWVRTGTESLYLWEWLRATDESLAGGDMPFAEFLQARETSGQACAASCAVSAVPQVRAPLGPAPH